MDGACGRTDEVRLAVDLAEFVESNPRFEGLGYGVPDQCIPLVIALDFIVEIRKIFIWMRQFLSSSETTRE